MLAAGSFLAFVLALVFYVAGGSVLHLYVDAALAGFVLLSAHFAFGERVSGYWGARRGPVARP